MAKTSYVDILPELEDQFFLGIKSSDRFLYSRLVKKITLFSRKSKKGLKAKSLLPQIAELWAGELTYPAYYGEAIFGISEYGNIPVEGYPAYYGQAIFGVSKYGSLALPGPDKSAWNDSGAQMNLNGWRLFVQDQSIRIINDMPGTAIPSLLHQSWVGGLRIEAPASELKIIQVHPKFYWISKKVKGKKGMYEPVLITEDLALPVKISLNYRSELSVAGSPNFAKFYVRFWHSYQGADQYTDLEIPLDYSVDWKRAEAELTTLIGYVIRYDMYIWLKGLTGDFYFDNVKVEHSGQNWARDPNCKDINQGFTRAFYQIPKHWAGVIAPAGASYESVYKDF